MCTHIVFIMTAFIAYRHLLSMPSILWHSELVNNPPSQLLAVTCLYIKHRENVARHFIERRHFSGLEREMETLEWRQRNARPMPYALNSINYKRLFSRLCSVIRKIENVCQQCKRHHFHIKSCDVNRAWNGRTRLSL